MFVTAAATALLVGIPAALGGQVPALDGVWGAVSSNSSQRAIVATSTVPAVVTPGKLRVAENSGVCETTPGVYQASGYGDIASNESIWCVFNSIMRLTAC